MNDALRKRIAAGLDREGRREEGRPRTEAEQREWASITTELRAFVRQRMTPSEQAADDELAARLQAGVTAFEEAANELRRTHGEEAVQRLAGEVLDDLMHEIDFSGEFLASIRRDPPKQ